MFLNCVLELCSYIVLLDCVLILSSYCVLLLCPCIVFLNCWIVFLYCVVVLRCCIALLYCVVVLCSWIVVLCSWIVLLNFCIVFLYCAVVLRSYIAFLYCVLVYTNEPLYTIYLENLQKSPTISGSFAENDLWKQDILHILATLYTIFSKNLSAKESLIVGLFLRKMTYENKTPYAS